MRGVGRQRRCIRSARAMRTGAGHPWPCPLPAGWADKFVCLYAGTQGYIHAVETVLGAAERLKAQKDIVFALLGGGPGGQAVGGRHGDHGGG